MLELLNQLDGFDSRGDVKVIMATNRIETLDPALIRPGQSERLLAHLQGAAESCPVISPRPYFTNYNLRWFLSDIYLVTYFKVRSWLNYEIGIYLYYYIYHRG